MSSLPILADVSELTSNPIRTGIQRVVRAVLRHWPGPRPLLPCRFDAACNGLVPLPPRAVALLTEADPKVRALSAEQVGQQIGEAVAAGPRRPLDLGGYDRILIPELFFDSARCHFYRDLLARRPDSAAFLAYDFIPWLRPELMWVDRTHHLMPYLTTLVAARRVAFISKATRDAFAHRILRQDCCDGVVLPLGADGLRVDGADGGVLHRQRFRPDRCLFVAIGSIDGRKNQDRIVAAFAKLRAAGIPARLAVVGGAFQHRQAQAQARAVAAAAEADPDGIQYLSRASDAEVATLLSRARATLYVSDAEGYGLPPVEGLDLGIPVIVGGDVPSVQELPPAGQVRLASPTVEALAAAVQGLMDDAAADQLWAEAANLSLPTWSGFAEATATWLHG